MRFYYGRVKEIENGNRHFYEMQQTRARAYTHSTICAWKVRDEKLSPRRNILVIYCRVRYVSYLVWFFFVCLSRFVVTSLFSSQTDTFGTLLVFIVPFSSATDVSMDLRTHIWCSVPLCKLHLLNVSKSRNIFSSSSSSSTIVRDYVLTSAQASLVQPPSASPSDVSSFHSIILRKLVW